MLGEGRFGTVYRAFHKDTLSLFALKKIPKSVIKEHFMVDQFILEVKLQSFFNHENILKIFGVFDDKENIYLILEYMEEGTLFAVLKKNKTLSEEVTSRVMKEISEAVVHMHNFDVAHRDIKPENIVISNGVFKLCDFGWATIVGDERRKTHCGTLDYVAPEILDGR